jgi:hypothetical protein
MNKWDLFAAMAEYEELKEEYDIETGNYWFATFDEKESVPSFRDWLKGRVLKEVI